MMRMCRKKGKAYFLTQRVMITAWLIILAVTISLFLSQHITDGTINHKILRKYFGTRKNVASLHGEHSAAAMVAHGCKCAHAQWHLEAWLRLLLYLGLPSLHLSAVKKISLSVAYCRCGKPTLSLCATCESTAVSPPQAQYAASSIPVTISISVLKDCSRRHEAMPQGIAALVALRWV